MKKDETINVLDSDNGLFFTKWPHVFNTLSLKYAVPDSFLVTLLFLWSATVGSINHGDGEIALSQIPVRPRYLRKYIEALVRARFFEKVQAGPESEKGSWYSYDDEKTAEDWDAFFSSVARVCALGGLDDDLSPDKFAKLVDTTKPQPMPRQLIQLRDGAYDGETPIPMDEKTRARADEVIRGFDRLARRKLQESGHPRKGKKARA